MPGDTKPSPVWLAAKPFVLGGTSGVIATSCIQPIDTVKVRIQLLTLGGKKLQPGEASPFRVASNIVKQDGVLGLYKGLSSAYLRQITYGTARLGLFRTFSNKLQEGDKPLPLYLKAAASLSAGALAAIIGTPADLALVRMQADGSLPVDQRRNYKGVGDALMRTVREEGVLGLWKGCTPTVVRAAFLNLGMLASFGQTREALERLNGGPSLAATLTASFVAGVMASAMSLPFDFVKTRLQNQKAGPDGVMPYKGSIDCALKTIKTDGPLGLYRGFPTYVFRIGPHSMITLVTLTYLNDLAKKYE